MSYLLIYLLDILTNILFVGILGKHIPLKKIIFSQLETINGILMVDNSCSKVSMLKDKANDCKQLNSHKRNPLQAST